MSFATEWQQGGPYSVVVANAPGVDLRPELDLLRAAVEIIAADGGARALTALGLQPQLLIGDLDSLAAADVTAAVAGGAVVERYSPNKDETDLELALTAAQRRGARRILVLAALGGRWDQSFANIALLALPELRGCEVVLRADGSVLRLIHDQVELSGTVGSTVSLLPFGGAAHGVTTVGLAYPLYDATLHVERSRGISNVVLERPARVALRSGLLLVCSDEP